MQDSALLLRDIHHPPAPSLWPPAPGWWLVGGAILLALVLVMAWRWHRVRRQRKLLAVFDVELAAAASPPAQVAAMSQLLRRAARRIDPQADRLQGDAWLAFLDQHGVRPKRGERSRGTSSAFTDGPGQLLLEGPFRREVGPDDVAALRVLARLRFGQWMSGS